MPPNWKTVYGEPFDEEKWKRAKERAEEEGHAEDWEYVVGIYKRMARTGEYKPKYSSSRKKKNQTVSEWKEKNPDWKKRAHKVANKSMVDNIGGMKLMVGHNATLDEFRCGNCGALLFKGRNLEKAMIEVKCRKCGKIVVSPQIAVIE
jgi:predicted RNA-binding Zn-ribbon protein involved in translation (DUF1610 family)